VSPLKIRLAHTLKRIICRRSYATFVGLQADEFGSTQQGSSSHSLLKCATVARYAECHFSGFEGHPWVWIYIIRKILPTEEGLGPFRVLSCGGNSWRKQICCQVRNTGKSRGVRVTVAGRWPSLNMPCQWCRQSSRAFTGTRQGTATFLYHRGVKSLFQPLSLFQMLTRKAHNLQKMS
jgi:RNase P subunit RPR2